MSRYLVWMAAVLLLVGLTPGLMATARAQDEMGAEEAAAEEAAPAAAEAPAEMEEPESIEDPEYYDEFGENYEDASADFLESTSEFLDDNSVFGVVRFRFDLGADLIYDSNIFLNDEDERDTQGVVSDTILRLNAGVAAEMKVNSRYTKLFKRDRITLVRFDYSYNKYFDNDEVTNSGWALNSDLFGFFSDLLTAKGGKGTGLYYRFKLDYSRLTDPMDLIIREAFSLGFPVVAEVDQLERDEITVQLELGWKGNGWDIALAYEYYELEFDDDVFASANNEQDTFWGEFGVNVLARTRLYVRGKWQEYRFPEQLLNDADVSSTVLGLDGLLFSKKIRYDINGGRKYWDSVQTGVVGDDSDYDAGIFWGQIVYQPWEDKKLSFQLEAGRDVDWSAISNYRIDDRIFLSIRDEFMPNRLSWDITGQISYHEQSQGPRWDRLEAGAGLTWTPHRQLTVTLRYLYRNQDSDEDYEIVNLGASAILGREIATNGNFEQHVVSLGAEVRF